MVRVGTGLAFALKRKITITNRTSTKTVMTVMIQNRKSWNHTMFSITGEAASCRPICHGEGWPRPAWAAVVATTAAMTPDTTCKSIRIRKSIRIVGSLLRPMVAAMGPELRRTRAGRLLSGRSSQRHRAPVRTSGEAAATGGIPCLSNHNSTALATCLVICRMRQSAAVSEKFRRLPLSGCSRLDLPILDMAAAHYSQA